MGYYTRYTLETVPADACTQLKAQAILQEVTNENYLIGEQFEDKWYDHKQHMLEISKKCPNVKFTLTGYGEDCAPDIDVFELTYFNGKLVKYLRGEIVMVPIDVG